MMQSNGAPDGRYLPPSAAAAAAAAAGMDYGKTKDFNWGPPTTIRVFDIAILELQYVMG